MECLREQSVFKQVALDSKLAASYRRGEACHQQLQSRAVSAAGAQVGLFSQNTGAKEMTCCVTLLMQPLFLQRLKANLEAEELLRGNYLKQTLTLKSSLQASMLL